LEHIVINGNKAPPGFPKRTIFYGEGVFETFRFRSVLPLFFEKHYARMKRGAGILGIPLAGMEDFARLIKESLSEARMDDAYVKVCLLSDGGAGYYDRPNRGDILVIVRDYVPRTEPVRMSRCSFGRSSESPVHRIKSLNYLENVIARRGANLMGFDESLFLNEKGEISECTSSNIFWVRDGTLYTPSLDCGILPGITREILINSVSSLGLTVEEGGFSPEDLTCSECTFLTNSISGSVPISQLGELKLHINNDLYNSIETLLYAKLGWE
jgi:4-amino-4-deoxychorismate lyase